MRDSLILTQTDTTIGFVSQNSTKIDVAKKRLPNKHYIRAVDSLKSLQRFSRVPHRHKNQVRRSRRTTFIMPNGLSLRLVKESRHNLLLDRVGWLYTSSANLSGFEYNEIYAREVAEVIIESPLQTDREASKIYYLGVCRVKSIR
jgi:tRNA A37 threonylcarbamoyladenosine synthetase subunit TsaC/SUA5/YrdC